jgi:hypothetical protein
MPYVRSDEVSVPVAKARELLGQAWAAMWATDEWPRAATRLPDDAPSERAIDTGRGTILLIADHEGIRVEAPGVDPKRVALDYDAGGETWTGPLVGEGKHRQLATEAVAYAAHAALEALVKRRA